MVKKIKIGKKIISTKSPVFIIAEAGVNHNGDLDLALKLIDAAAKAGADAVKFQTFKASQVVTAQGKMAEYQKKNIGKIRSQIEMIRNLEIDDKWYPRLIKHCQDKKIIFLSAPHGHIESADLLKKYGVCAYKIASGDLNNRPLLEYVARFKKPIILSTGMANMREVKEAMSWIKRAGNSKVIVLHCTTNYPCLHSEVNLAAMQTMMKKLNGTLIGYSDHTKDDQTSIMAVLLGARIIERHITLNKELPGPDHKASLNPQEFEKFVSAIRNIPKIMGSSLKNPTKSELQFLPTIRKSIVAKKNIRKGEKLTTENLTVKRPGTGLSPKYFSRILNKTANVDIKQDTLINEQMIDN